MKKNILTNLKSKLFDFLCILPYLDICITTRCNLNCKECSHFMPVYKSQGKACDFDTAKLLSDIDLILSKINRCNKFSISGGEPFLHKDLDIIIDKLCKNKKVKIVKIVTNGTVLPTKEKLLLSLAHEKVLVAMSNYGELSAKKDELKSLFEKRNIKYHVSSDKVLWRKTDMMTPKGYSENKAAQIYKECDIKFCKTLYEGKLWLCPLCGYATKLGLVENSAAEYIDLTNCKKGRFWKELKRMYKVPYHNICKCCNGGARTGKIFSSAVQE